MPSPSLPLRRLFSKQHGAYAEQSCPTRIRAAAADTRVLSARLA